MENKMESERSHHQNAEDDLLAQYGYAVMGKKLPAEELLGDQQRKVMRKRQQFQLPRHSQDE